jgi:shikimate dehydrogenase
MAIFPAWAAALGLSAAIRGVDLPLNASAEDIRAVFDEMATDPAAVGALVTTHKASMFDYAADRFTEIDTWGRLCREISCISFRDGAVLGWAKDPITSRQAYTWFLGEQPWRDDPSDVVCIGAGGAGLALMMAILGQESQPRRFVLTDRDPARLAIARDAVALLPVSASVEYHLTDRIDATDRIVSAARHRSLIVNATGMGKDLAGSPVTEDVDFPHGAAVWDMNYRGELLFLDIAARQAGANELTVSDGWQYFLHGWTEVISEVFKVPMTNTVFAELKSIAEEITGRRPAAAVRNPQASRE